MELWCVAGILPSAHCEVPRDAITGFAVGELWPTVPYVFLMPSSLPVPSGVCFLFISILTFRWGGDVKPGHVHFQPGLVHVHLESPRRKLAFRCPGSVVSRRVVRVCPCGVASKHRLGRGRYVTHDDSGTTQEIFIVVANWMTFPRHNFSSWNQTSRRCFLLHRDRLMAGGRSPFGCGGPVLVHVCGGSVVVAGILPRGTQNLAAWFPASVPCCRREARSLRLICCHRFILRCHRGWRSRQLAPRRRGSGGHRIG